MTLTSRQREIMHWVSLGKTNAEIGQILGISMFTVKNHVRMLIELYAVSNRTQLAVRFAVDQLEASVMETPT